MAETVPVELDADEAWLLYRLATADHGAQPCLLDQPHREHALAAETVLRKLAAAMSGLPAPQAEALPTRLAQLLAAIRAEGGDWSPARAMNAYGRLGWQVTPERGHANMKRLAELGYLEQVRPRAYTYRLIESERER